MAEITATLLKEHVLTEDSDAARDLYSKSLYGAIAKSRVELSFIEALYLLKKGKVDIYDGRKKLLDEDTYTKKIQRKEPNFYVRYKVFEDIRQRGYIIKTALKFGADFRVYDRGVKPGDDHAKWVVFPVHESSAFTWFDFAAKNRVAHSTKKRLLLAVVDSEGDVSYWESRWIRP